MIISILGAVVLWMYVLSEVNPEVTTTFPNIKVAFQNEQVLEEKQLSIMDKGEFSVSVRLIGKRIEMDKVSAEDITASVDLAHAQSGENNLKVNVKFPSNVALDQTNPVLITVKMENVIESEREINIAYTGNSQAGKEAIIESLSPSKITIKGPLSQVSTVWEVRATADLSAITKSQTMNVPIVLIDYDGKEKKGIIVSAEKVKAHAILMDTKNVPLKVVTTNDKNQLGQFVELINTPKTVQVVGTAETLANVNQIETKPVDISNVVTPDRELTLHVNLPEDVYLSRSNSTIKANVRLLDTLTEEFAAKDIFITGLAEGLKAEISEEGFAVTIKFAQNTTGAGRLTLDLTGLDEGTHLVDLKYESGRPLIDKQLEPKQATVTITK